MTIPGICVFKSTHGGKKELFNILLFLKGKLSLFLRDFGGSFPWKPALNDNFYGINVFIGWTNDCTLVLAPKFWNLDNFWLSYGTFSEKKSWFAFNHGYMVILLLKLTKSAITQPNIVQIPNFWCQNQSIIICPYYQNIFSTKHVIKGWFSGERTTKNHQKYA